MNPTLIVLAVRAAVRLGRAGADSLGQHARDRAVLLPSVREIKFPEKDHIRAEFTLHPELIREEIKPYWISFDKGTSRLAGDYDVVAVEYARIQAQRLAQDAALPADEFAALWMVDQWSQAAAPVGPIARVVLTLVDVAASFAAHDPKLFGMGSKAELLVQAIAQHLAELIPDNVAEFGARNLFGQRLAGIFLRAGLTALGEHPEIIIDQAHLQLLVGRTLPVLVARLPQTLSEEVKWRDAIESLLEPLATEAVKAIVTKPEVFFRTSSQVDDLASALTRAFLLRAAQTGFNDVFTRRGAVQLYRAALQVASSRPELFVGAPADASDRFVLSLLRDLSTVALAGEGVLNRQSVSELAVVALETLAEHGGAMLKPNAPWENLLSQTLTPLLQSIAAAMKPQDRSALSRLKHDAALHALTRIILAQVASTPGMVGESSCEVANLTSCVAMVMAADTEQLLTHEAWLQIIVVAAEEIAANPSRLIAVDSRATKRGLMAGIMIDLLSVATSSWSDSGRAGGAVLFGPTLREALVLLIRAAAGNADAAQRHGVQLRALAEALSSLVTDQPGKYGSREWLQLYRVLLVQVLDTGVVGPLDEMAVKTVLAGAALR